MNPILLARKYVNQPHVRSTIETAAKQPPVILVDCYQKTNYSHYYCRFVYSFAALLP